MKVSLVFLVPVAFWRLYSIPYAKEVGFLIPSNRLFSLKMCFCKTGTEFFTSATEGGSSSLAADTFLKLFVQFVSKE